MKNCFYMLLSLLIGRIMYLRWCTSVGIVYLENFISMAGL